LVFVDAVEERPGFLLTDVLDALKVIEEPANLEPAWEAATRQLKDSCPMDSKQSGSHVVAEPLVGAQDGPSTHASLGYPYVVAKPLFGSAIHRPEGVHDESLGAECICDLVTT
jgi:hypothetical protein